MQYIKNLDGVRALAIILVMLFHYDFILQFGWVGVQLFFVLSGYLITTILLEDKKQPLSLYLKGFYWRRSLRIFPVYYFYIAIIGIGFLLFQKPEHYLTILPYLLSYTYNLFPLVGGLEFDAFFTHFWSLSIEEQFYLMWPLLVYFCGPNQLKYIIVAIIMLCPAFRYLFAEYLMHSELVEEEFVGEVVYRFTPNQLDSFAIGAVIPVFSLTKRVSKTKWLFFLSLMVMIAAGVANLLNLGNDYSFVTPSSMGYHIGLLVNFQHVWSYTVLGITFMTLILWCLQDHQNRFLKIVFENRVMVFIGKISYGIYIYHWVLMMAFGKFFGAHFKGLPLLGFMLYSVICIGLAYASYKIVEKPFLALKGKYFGRGLPSTH